MKITIIGTGYVGLVTGACLADTGNEVWCVDKNQEKINQLRDGVIPIYEPGLEPLVQRGVKEERLFLTTDLAKALPNTQICFLTVDTPPGPDGHPDLTNIFAVAESLGEHLTPPCLVVTKSTVPVGTTLKVKEKIISRLKARGVASDELTAASNPEFLKEGTSVQDFRSPDRIVVGVEKEADANVLRELFAPFMRRRDRFLVMDITSAELSKYAANAMLAARISFMNELASLSETVGADIDKIRQAIGWDRRIGPHFLYPGLGYGGSCLPKDIAALLQLGKEKDCPLTLLEAVHTINQKQRGRFLKKIVSFFGSPQNLSGKTIAFWGISFKPETDDIREAPAIYLIEKLLNLGAAIQAFDPVAMTKARAAIQSERAAWMPNNYACLNNADALVICTEWNEFRSPDFAKMKRLMRQPVIFDGRNLYKASTLKTHGFLYHRFGESNHE